MKKRRVLTAALALLLLVCMARVGWLLLEGRSRSEEYHSAAEIAGLPDLPQPPAAQPSPPPSAPEEGPAPLPEEFRALADLDLAALREVNADVAGWIEIPGTEVSYPLLQGTDNQYYLTHTWKGGSNSGGAIFLEHTASPDLSDFHTIIYGHRMRDGSMFGALRHYRDPAFLEAHPSVYLVTGEGVFRYDIFSARETGVTELTYRLDLVESGLQEDFLRDCLEGSVVDTGVIPQASERILTLSTCTGAGYAKRWVVHAVLRASTAGEESPQETRPPVS